MACPLQLTPAAGLGPAASQSAVWTTRLQRVPLEHCMRLARCSSGESELSLSVVVRSLLDAHSLLGSLMKGKSSAESSSLLLSQVLWGVLFLFEFVSGTGNSLLAQYGQNLGNRLSHLLMTTKVSIT